MKQIKNLKRLSVIVLFLLSFIACEKNKTLQKFDSIQGMLILGENVTTNDFSQLEVYLGKLHVGVDLTTFTAEAEEVDFEASASVNEDGSFEFSNLSKGNYVVFLPDEFTFSDESYLLVEVDGYEKIELKKSIERVSAENIILIGDNITAPTRNRSYRFKIFNETNYNDLQLCYYENDEAVINPVDFPDEVYWDCYISYDANKTRMLQIVRSNLNIPNSEFPKIQIPMMWFTKTYSSFSHNGELLNVCIKSCIGYKKLNVRKV